MLTTVVIVLLLTGSVALYTFTGGTENGSFTCHCSPDTQCDDDTGACPGDVCGQSGSFSWFGPGCQIGNVALLGGTAQQTGNSSHVAERCIDGDLTRNIRHGSCCIPTRIGDELSWSVDLGGLFLIKSIVISTDVLAGSDVEVYVSSTGNSTDMERCREHLKFAPDLIHVYPIMILFAAIIGRYVYIRPSNVSMEEMEFCEVRVSGSQYHACGFYDGDYRYGPGCIGRCHCEHQCDVITGVCDGDCDNGYHGVNCQEACDSHHWGSNCTNECHCICDSITGECVGLCDHGYYGNRCQYQCTNETWGQGDESGCPNNCYCTVTCDKVDGGCDGPCLAGRHGNACQYVCDDGAWGEDCLNTCNCYGDEVCEKTDGSCDRCRDWYVGDRCDQRLPRMGNVFVVPLNDSRFVHFVAPRNADYYTVEYKTDDDWMMMTRYQTNASVIVMNVEYNIDYPIRIVPWMNGFDQPGESSQVIGLEQCDDGWWGTRCEYECRCLDPAEVCNIDLCRILNVNTPPQLQGFWGSNIAALVAQG